jgi:glucokinase
VTAPCVIGVDVGGTKILAGVLDAGGAVLERHEVPTPMESQDELVEALLGAAETLLQDRVEAAGYGLPSRIDQRTGTVLRSTNIPLNDVAFRELAVQRLGVPVAIDNDANVAALAEHLYGAGRGARDVVLLTIGTGIGGGLVLGGEVYRGSTGAGAELGHIVIIEDGLPCQGNCPNHGCVETYASGTAIAREGTAVAEREPDSELGKALAKGPIVGRTVTELALAGDPLATEVVAQAGRHLGTALASLANIFDPDVFVIGGGVSAAGELLIGPAQEELRSRALPPQNDTPVKLAELGPEAGMIGAAAMALIELDRKG